MRGCGANCETVTEIRLSRLKEKSTPKAECVPRFTLAALSHPVYNICSVPKRGFSIVFLNFSKNNYNWFVQQMNVLFLASVDRCICVHLYMSTMIVCGLIIFSVIKNGLELFVSMSTNCWRSITPSNCSSVFFRVTYWIPVSECMWFFPCGAIEIIIRDKEVLFVQYTNLMLKKKGGGKLEPFNTIDCNAPNYSLSCVPMTIQWTNFYSGILKRFQRTSILKPLFCHR